jgi:hypothetical protein
MLNTRPRREKKYLAENQGSKMAALEMPREKMSEAGNARDEAGVVVGKEAR